MLIAIGELFSKVGRKLSFSIDKKADDNWKVRQIVEFLSPVSLNGEVENLGNSFSLKGSGNVTVAICCDRCLNSVNNEISFDLDEVFTSANVENDSEEETEIFTGDTIDITHIVRKNILSNLPMKCLCDEDCKGLCLKCGQDLNHEDCGCDTREIDPRLEILSTLFNNNDEEV